MVALLSVLSSLERLSLRFQSPQSRPDLESLQPPPSRLFVIPSFPPVSMVEDLRVELGRFLYGVWKDDAIESALWLELLLSFPAVKDLYLAKELAPGIAAALQQLVGRRITEVLPSVRNIFVKGIEPQEPFREHIEEFVAARQLSGHPDAISVWRSVFEWEFVPLAAETVEN